MRTGDRPNVTAPHPWRGLWLALAAVALVALLWLSLAGSLAAARARVYPQPAIALSVSLPSARAHPNDPLTFTATSRAGHDLTYSWEFGDGQRATGPNATHLYSIAGTFTATLTATDPVGQRATVARQVTIYPQPPRASFTFLQTPSEPLRVGFFADNAQQNSNLNYAWDFGDGATTQTALPATQHVYARFGTYTVTLTETDSAGQSDTTTQRITLARPEVQAIFKILPTADSTRTFIFDSIASTGALLTYRWDFGDGATTQGTSMTVEHTYQQPGTYTVTLTVTDAQGTTSTSGIALVVS